MRVVFMGTPEFAVPCLQKLIDCGHEVTAVFTQPDKPQGRKMILTPPPVKVLAAENGIKVYQPVKMRDGTALEMLKEADPELVVVVAYGKILPKEIRVYEITGPLFFGASDRITQISMKEFTKCLILRMRSVPAIDVTAMNALEELRMRCERQGISLIFSHVNDQPMRVMEKAGFVEKIGRENFCDHIDSAIIHAQQL